jgi:hypothetical protein
MSYLGYSLRSDGDLGHSLLVFRYSGSEAARTFLLLYTCSFAAQANKKINYSNKLLIAHNPTC